MNLMRIMKIVLLVIGVAFLGLALLLSQSAKRKLIDVEAQLRPYLTDTVSKQNAVANEAELKIEQAVNVFEKSMRAALPDVEKKLCGFRNSCGLVKDMALDKVKGGNRVEERLATALNTITAVPAKRLNRELEEIYANELNQLDNNAQEMLTAITTEYQIIAGKVLPLELKAELTDNLRVSTTVAASKHMFMTGTLSIFEAIFLKPTVRALRSLASRLYRKPAAKAVAGAVTSAADGPLPIGDIVAAGLTAWTAVDIYKSDKEMRHVTQKAFEQSLTQIVDDYRKEALACARAYKDAANNDLAEVFNTVVTQTGNK